MYRTIGMGVVLAALAAAPAAAQSLIDAGAAMGVHGTLAQGSASNVAGTINAVRKAVDDASASHNAQIADHAQAAWGGKGPSRWMTNDKNGSGRGWAEGGAWGRAQGAAGGGWALASADNGRGWASGAWGEH